MPLTVVLAVGVDSYLFGPQRAIWQSAGLFVTSAGSMREAIDQFRFGDFDLVLLGHSIERAKGTPCQYRAPGGRKNEKKTWRVQQCEAISILTPASALRRFPGMQTI